MPQMAPMWWMTLFIFFTMMLILINIMNFFTSKYSMKKLSKINYSSKINWKW